MDKNKNKEALDALMMPWMFFDFRGGLANDFSSRYLAACMACFDAHPELSNMLKTPIDKTVETMHQRGIKLIQFAVQSMKRPVEKLSTPWKNMLFETIDLKSTEDVFIVGETLNDPKFAHFETLAKDPSFKKIFVFHGSPTHNWFSIMRNELSVTSQSRYATTGMAYGAGIYASHELVTSLAYTSRTESLKRKFPELISPTIKFVGIFEALVGASEDKTHYVITDPLRVRLRWIMLCKGAEVCVLPKSEKKFEPLQKLYQMQCQDLFPRTVSAPLMCTELEHQMRMSQTWVDTFSAAHPECVWNKDVHVRVAKRQDWDTARPATLKRLQQEFSKMIKTPNTGFAVHLPDQDNLFRWWVRIQSFADAHVKDTLAHDLAQTKEKEVCLEILFRGDFPHRPPFVRVMAPRFVQMTGHVLMNGAVCSDFLTSGSWNSAYDMEQIFVTLQSLLVQGNGRLEKNNTAYSLLDSFTDFDRMLATHGWKQ
jgi:ubiquitin-protein ligase